MTITFTFNACGHSVNQPTDSALIAGKTCSTNGYCPTCQAAIRADRDAQVAVARKHFLATLDPRTYFIPTRDFVEDLKVGDLAPSSLGWKTVKEISYRGDDVNGRAFVGYYVDFGNGSTLSASIKDGELVRTLATSNHHTSAELDLIQDDAVRFGYLRDAA